MQPKHNYMLKLLAVAVVAATAFVLMSATASLHSSMRQPGPQVELAARLPRQKQLESRLRSTNRGEFLPALSELNALDEPGLARVWQAALKNQDEELRAEAWRSYRDIGRDLVRKEFVPKVVRIRESARYVEQIAAAAGIEVTVWNDGSDGVTAAAPSYLIDELRSRGIEVDTLFETIADWQSAKAERNALAQQITPAYQEPDAQKQIRIAVIDLSRSRDPEPGYSNWLGDSEDILMRNDSFLAHLDVVSRDDSSADGVQRYLEERYTRRGYTVAGFFTPEEFSRAVSRFFPDKKFEAGRRPVGGIRLQAAEGAFHSYPETLSEFTALAQAHPELARLVNLGTSYEGRQIFALKISADPAINDPNKPDVLITGCHHAREWISVEPPVYFANKLINSYATDTDVKHLVDNLEIWIVPISNPDGLVYTQSSSNFDFNVVRLWRKNRKPITGYCTSGTGVDINRNYGYLWRLPTDTPCPNYRDDAGGSDQVEQETFRGTEPNSELEVRALNSLTDDPNQKFMARLDYHNFSELILRPWGYQNAGSPDEGTLAELGQQISDVTRLTENHRYVSQRAIFLYQTSGTSTDYAYGANGTPAAFTIELRPVCCDFAVPENEIDPINRENWAGAKVVLGWSVGPPILRGVKAYQKAADGTLTKLVYSARWIDGSGSRQKVVDLRFPRIEPGRIQVHLQFSKPMRTSESPNVTMGRSGSTAELTLAAVDSAWQRTIYNGDTWVGEAEIPEEVQQTGDWQLSVAAKDATQLQLDAKPGTAASYQIGTDQWSAFEDSTGAGWVGGADREHLLPPTLRADDLVLKVGAPRPNERFAGGDVYEVAWTVPTDPSFRPTQQEIWLSTDGGFFFAPIVTGIPPSADRRLVQFPRVTTTSGIIRVFSRGLNVTFGDNEGTFTIGTNIGSAFEVSVASSQLIEQGWTDQLSGAGAQSGPARLVVDVRVTNRGTLPVANPFLRVSDLTRNNVLLSRSANSLPNVGALQNVEVGSDGILAPGRTAPIRLLIGLMKFKKFNLNMDVYGVPSGGQITPSSSFLVWQGKPRTQ